MVDIVVSQAVVVEPVANAGDDFGVLPLEMVTLDGRASYDPSGLDPLVYAWTLISRPQGSTTSLSSTTAAQPSFFADLAGVYVFELTVQNTAGTWDTTPDVVQIEAIPLDGFYVELSWDNNNDLDLHILNGGAALWSDGDCNYCNLNPSWGPGGGEDDPSLDADAIDGYGPETTTIDVPAAGSYGINVHYYGLNGGWGCNGFTCPSSQATVKGLHRRRARPHLHPDAGHVGAGVGRGDDRLALWGHPRDRHARDDLLGHLRLRGMTR